MNHVRVLIVDDEQELVDTLVERLEMRDIDAIGATNGAQALQLVSQKPFDIVLLDVRLPHEDGLEILRRLRALQPSLPVVLLTGNMSEETKEEGLHAGALAYLLKPLNIEQLVALIKKITKNS